MATGLVGCASSPPKQFTRSADEFTPCSSAPHCVSSQAPRDSSKYVEPLRFAGATVAAARQALLKALYEADNARVERTEERFVHVTFRTTTGFVDDVAFLIQPEAQIIDVKSSSRIGYYDFNVNRKRVEHLRARFNALLDTPS
ncbi:hypothetical protein SADO_07582 [Salinisphaera dokdonensis CL-ES53]|uniref:DUF1499 domain-containing protein n=2 Tax=Salinisphaera TaxID=180541 RepID=A0ABV2AZM7_9GAMM